MTINSPTPGLTLTDHHLVILRFKAGHPVPRWLDLDQPFVALTRTTTELSIVCEEAQIPIDRDESGEVERAADWRAFRVNGPLDLTLVGVLASIAVPLADAKISLFAISTFDTDYILVQADQLDAARAILARTFDIMIDD